MMKTNKALLFIGGDLSGIQKFIYNISSKKAMVSLKGRSAYLCDYSKALCEGILDLEPLKEDDQKKIIFCSGGKFYIIVGDAPLVRSAIDEYYHRCEQEMWKEHHGQLGLAIAYVPFFISENGKVTIDGEEYDQIGVLWERVSELFSHMKNQRFKGLFQEQYNEMFEVIPDGGETRVCAITGIEDKTCVRLEKDKDGEDIWVLPSVAKQIEIGRSLKAKEGFKTLEEYSEGTYIGVLRMDVDGLGSRFIKGFKSFDEYTAFSNKLSAFFNLKLKEIQKKYQNNLNIVYAGGDDLFAVGRWDKVIDFASEVHDKFIDFIAPDNLTISGGLAIVGAKFPIAKSADISGEAENDAKRYKDGQKNAFSFLGECVSWGKEFDKVKNMKDDLVYHISNNGVSRGLLHQIMKYADVATEGKDPSYKWHETYYLSRMIQRQGHGQSPSKEFLSRLLKEGVTRTSEDYRLLSLSARWAELILRNIDKNIN